MCGFSSLGDWKKILAADAELVHTRTQLKNEKKRTVNLTTQVATLRGQVDVYANTQNALVERNAKLTKDLIDLDKKYQYERAKPRWGSPVAWTVAAVSTSVLAGVLLKNVLD